MLTLWIEVHTVTSATSKVTTDKMRVTFSTHGLPEILVTDNGIVFTSVEFETFLSRNGIRHITSARSHLDQLHPDLSNSVRQSQERKNHLTISV